MTSALRDKPLISNGYSLSTAPDRLGRLIPSGPDVPIAELRSQYQEQGYLWLKGILDRSEVLAFRRRYFAAFVGAGLLAMLSARAGQGAGNALLHARLGIEAIRQCRPLPFMAEEPPRLANVRKALFDRDGELR